MKSEFECCRDCPDRCPEPNCHSHCEKFIEASEIHRIKEEELKQKRREYHNAINAEIASQIRRKKRRR